MGIIFTSYYLGISDLVELEIKSFSLSQSFSDVAKLMDIAASGDFDSALPALTDLTASVICNHGWDAGFKKWRGIPPALVFQSLSSDSFFVPDEWERILFLIKLSFFFKYNSGKWREYKPVVKLLFDRHVYYSNLTTDQLYILEGYSGRSTLGLMDVEIIRRAISERSTIQSKLGTNALKLGLFERISLKNDDNFKKLCKNEIHILHLECDTHFGPIVYVKRRIIGDGEVETTIYPNNKKHFKLVSSIPPLRASFTFKNIHKLQRNEIHYSHAILYHGSIWKLGICMSLDGNTGSDLEDEVLKITYHWTAFPSLIFTARAPEKMSFLYLDWRKQFGETKHRKLRWLFGTDFVELPGVHPSWSLRGISSSDKREFISGAFALYSRMTGEDHLSFNGETIYTSSKVVGHGNVHLITVNRTTGEITKESSTFRPTILFSLC